MSVYRYVFKRKTLKEKLAEKLGAKFFGVGQTRNEIIVDTKEELTQTEVDLIEAILDGYYLDEVLKKKADTEEIIEILHRRE